MNHSVTFMVRHDLLHALKKDQPEPEKGTVGRGNALDLTQQFQVTTIRPISKNKCRGGGYKKHFLQTKTTTTFKNYTSPKTNILP